MLGKSYVIDFDIKGLFDNIPHELIYRALELFELDKWIMLPICNLLDNKIAKYMKRKYKIKSHGAAYNLVRKMKEQNPNLFYHWSFVGY